MKIRKKVRRYVRARGEETTNTKKKRERERGKEETQVVLIEANKNNARPAETSTP